MRITLKIFLLILPFILFYGVGLFVLDSHFTKNSYLYESINKRERLKNISSPKIVFIGGSSVAFGLDSKQIEEELGYSVVNMGLIADIGLRAMLLEVEEDLKAGDIVVAGAEYEQFLDYFYGRQTLVASLFDINKDFHKKLDFQSTARLFEPMHKYVLRKFAYNLSAKKAETTDIYSKSSFNKYGDIIAHWTKEPKTSIYNYAMQNTISPDAFEFTEKFKERMQSKNITFIMIPPPIQEKQFNINKKIIKEVQDELKKYNLSYIKTSHSYTFSDSLFFDSPYHLNRKGIDIRMQHLIFDIKKHLESKH